MSRSLGGWVDPRQGLLEYGANETGDRNLNNSAQSQWENAHEERRQRGELFTLSQSNTHPVAAGDVPNDNCAICMEPLSERRPICMEPRPERHDDRVLENCGFSVVHTVCNAVRHFFHAGCLRQALRYCPDCPACRTSLAPPTADDTLLYRTGGGRAPSPAETEIMFVEDDCDDRHDGARDDDDEEPEADAPAANPDSPRPPTPQQDLPPPAPAPRARPRRGHADRLPDGPPELAPGRRARGGAAGRGRRIRDPGPLGAIDFDADTGWREVIRELPREQKEMASHFTVDELPAREAAAFGNISKQIITHINRTADAEAIDLLALLPELLLTDRALTRNGTRRFLERCHQVVALRGLDDLLQRPDGRFRHRLASANDDERVQTDVLREEPLFVRPPNLQPLAAKDGAALGLRVAAVDVVRERLEQRDDRRLAKDGAGYP